MRKNAVKKSKMAALAIMTFGMTFASFCSAVDVKHNAVSGTMDFVEGWVEDLWGAVIPAPGDLFGGDAG